MYTVSTEFKNTMKSEVKEVDAYIQLSDLSKITSADNLVSIKVDNEGHLGQVAMRLLTIQLVGDYLSLKDQTIKLFVGVRTTAFEYIDYGSFFVREAVQNKASGMTEVKAYDLLIYTNQKYDHTQFTYPMTIYQLAAKICQLCGIEIASTVWPNSTLTINTDRYEGIEGIQYRDILEDIAATSGTIVKLSNDKLVFKKPTSVTETLNENNLMSFAIGDKYGPINSIVIARSPQEDNVVLKNDESVALNGLTEWRVDNVQLIYDQRENALQGIYDNLYDLTYYPFEAKTEGHGWHEVGDSINTNIDGETKKVFITNVSLFIDGSIDENIKGVSQSSKGTNYNRASSVEKRITRTEIIVDKQKGEIESIIQQVEGYDVQISQLEQNSESIVSNVAKIYYTKNEAQELEQTINTQFSQTNESFEMKFENIIQDLQATQTSTDAQFQNISKYIRFIDGNIVLGEENNLLTLRIENDKISFLENDVEIAYWQNRKFYAVDGEFINSLRLGNFAFIPRANGNLSFKKVGN